MTGQSNPSQMCTRHVMVLGKVNRLEAALDKNGVHAVCDELRKWMNSPRRSKQRKFDDLEQVLFEFGDDPHSMILKDINYLDNNRYGFMIIKYISIHTMDLIFNLRKILIIYIS